MPGIWAPRATTVRLLHDGAPIPMTKGADGWWRAPTDTASRRPENGGGRLRYRFEVDGEAFADPRSPWQPEGVHGPSSTDDGSSFPWTDGQWHGFPLASAVVYELHVGTFTASHDFAGVASKLDHLDRLGVNAVELLPLAEHDGRWGWGYDGVLPFAPHHRYGGPDGLRRLVDACHARGIAVIVDVVYNHFGPADNYLARFGPYFTERHHTPWGEAVNFDGDGSAEVRAFFLDNALHWIRDFHIDGLRLDAVHEIYDMSARHFLAELADAVRNEADRLGRTVWLIAESDLNDPRLVTAAEAGGYGLDAVWSDDFHHALHTWLTGESSGYYGDFRGLPDVAKALRDVYVYDGTFAPRRNRVHGRKVGDLPRRRFLGYAQNHDQIGNRAQGERLGHLVDEGAAAAAAALVALGPFVPMLFQGEEWNATSPFQYFTDHADPALAQAVRDGRRREFAAFGWDPNEVPDPQSPETFARSTLDWSEPERAPHHRMLEWYRTLYGIRRDLLDPAAELTVDADVEAGTLALLRPGLALLVNRGVASVRMGLPSAPADGDGSKSRPCPPSELGVHAFPAEPWPVPDAQGVGIGGGQVVVIADHSVRLRDGR